MRASTITRVMRQIAAGELSRGEAAVELDCSERTVNRLMREAGVQRPPSPVHEAREAAQGRRDAKQVAAEQVIAGLCTAEEAAAATGASLRTIYRWVKRVEGRK